MDLNANSYLIKIIIMLSTTAGPPIAEAQPQKLSTPKSIYHQPPRLNGPQLGDKKSADVEAQMDEIHKNLGNYSSDVYDENAQWWQNYWQTHLFNTEYVFGIKHIGDHDDVVRACYFIGTSYKNAITDIRHYFRMRYLYTNNLHFEVGFLTHEIVFKYQMLLEMFHIVQGRFHFNRTRFYAPTSYMLYMYSNILDTSKHIIHLCNMMHELEKKYARHPKTVFQDYHITALDMGNDKNQANIAAMQAVEKRRQEEYKRRMRELKKKRKQLIKTGIFSSVPRTQRRVVSNKHGWLHHYGWSIEDW